ncbi:Hypothetical protein FKW44_025052, partial [Caligus rogercresseyi]
TPRRCNRYIRLSPLLHDPIRLAKRTRSMGTSPLPLLTPALPFPPSRPVPVPQVKVLFSGMMTLGPTKTPQLVMKRVSEDELFDHLRKLRDHCHD